MVLGLKHVEDVGAEGLGGFDDVGAGSIILAVCGEGCGRFEDGDSVLQERVDEFCGGGEVGLVCGDDVHAGVTKFGVVED